MLRLNLAVLAGLLLPAAADLPVHCLRHQVVGEWVFTLTPPSKTRSPCGHLHPDTEEGQPNREVLSLVSGGKPNIVKKLDLQNPNIVKSEDGKHGTWTMIYDEGFEVNVDGNNFFAFSNFTFQQDPATKTKHNVSHCGDTMVGWYHTVDRTQYGCYYGHKTEKTPATPIKSVTAAVANQSAPMDQKKMTDKVKKLNKKLSMMQLGWKARVMPKWIGKTMNEINAYAGIKRTTPMRELHKDMMSQRPVAHSQSFLQAKGIKPHVSLPENFFWGNASGVNYLEPVMDQGSCGSCYAVAAMRMLTARHKIKTQNPDAVPWSINAPLFCGEYNQGCKGGYSILMAKWGQDVGLVPATCMRYNTEGSCSLECDLNQLEGKRYRVDNHRYVGSWYGNSSTQSMMEELYHNGPFVVGFEPADDFMFYSDGIYKSATLINKLHKTEQEWERVDHAVVVVGWGVEDGKKYWLIQNSWGEDWGEDGFFRMIRDENESGIESIPEAADVVEDEQQGARVSEFFELMKKKEL